MHDFTKAAALALLIASAPAAWAQETPAPAADATEAPAAGTTEAPATEVPGGLSTGQEVGAEAPADGVGSVYVAATHGDWEQRCVRTAEGSDPCQLYQLLKDSNGNSVAEVSMFGLPNPAKNAPAAGMTIIAPLETLLSENITLAVDGSKGKVYPFSFCSVEGCVARIGLLPAEIDAFKRGNAAKVTIVPVVAPDQKVSLEMSLKGFTAGYDAVNAANTPAPAAGGN